MPLLNQNVQTGVDDALQVMNRAFRPVVRRKDNGDLQVMTQRNGTVILQNGAGMRVNSVLRKDAWKALEAEVIAAQKLAMPAVERLRGKGLVITDDLGKIMHEWDVQSEIVRPSVSIDGRDPDNQDAPDIVRRAITVPVVHQGFTFGERAMRASNLMPNSSIDTSLAMAATQSVGEEFERFLFSGTGVKLSTYATTYGLTNHTYVNSTSNAGSAWSTFDGTEASDTITGVVRQFLQMMEADRYRGPFTLYLEYNNYLEASTTKYSGTTQTPLQHIMSWPTIEAVVPVSSEFLAHGTMVGVQEVPTVIRWVEEMPVNLVEWLSPDGWTHHFRVIGVGAPRVTADYDGRCGVGIVTGL